MAATCFTDVDGMDVGNLIYNASSRVVLIFKIALPNPKTQGTHAFSNLSHMIAAIMAPILFYREATSVIKFDIHPLDLLVAQG